MAKQKPTTIENTPKPAGLETETSLEASESEAAAAETPVANPPSRDADTPTPPVDDAGLGGKWAKPIAIGVFAIVSCGLVFEVFKILSDRSDQFVVNATVLKNDNEASVVGYVSSSGTPVEGADVSILVFDTGGTQLLLDSDPVDKTRAGGVFKIPIPLTGAALVDVLASQKATSFWRRSMTARQRIELAPTNALEKPTGMSGPVAKGDIYFGLFITIVFVSSVLVGVMIRPKTDDGARAKYYGIVSLAFMLPFLVAVSFVMAQSKMVGLVRSDPQARLSLGFAIVFKGTYVKSVPPDWIISLTLPTSEGGETVLLTPPTSEDGEPVPPDKGDSSSPSPPAEELGFGAPLWVLFLSVIGAGLSMLSLIINEIKDPPEFKLKDRPALRPRIHRLIEHQFYVLFAPVSGVFVYQLMVATKTANSPVMVALAALGAGMSLKLIVGRAVEAAEKLAVGTADKTKSPAAEQLQSDQQSTSAGPGAADGDGT